MQEEFIRIFYRLVNRNQRFSKKSVGKTRMFSELLLNKINAKSYDECLRKSHL